MKLLNRLVLTSSSSRFKSSASTVQIFFAAILLLVMPPAALAGDLTVCPSGCDYTSPELAVTDIGLVDGDTIDVATGTYVLSSTIQVDKNISIIGQNAVIDGNGVRIMTVTGANTNLELTGFTFQNGQADPGTGGGAIWISGGATVHPYSVTFDRNQADFGGAIYNAGSTLNAEGTIFIGNRATAGKGGAVFTDALGSTNLTYSVIDGNTATVAGGGVAVEGVDSQNRTLTSVRDTTISNNAALTSAVVIDAFTNPAVTPSTNCGIGPYGQTFIAGTEAISAFHYRIRVAGGAAIPAGLEISGLLREDGPFGTILATATATLPGGLQVGDTPIVVFELDHPVATDPLATYAIETEVVGNYSILTTSNPGFYADGQKYSCDTTLDPNGDYDFQIVGGTPVEGSGVHASLGAQLSLENSTVSGNAGDGLLATTGGIIDARFATIANNSRSGATAVPIGPGVTEPGLVFLIGSILAGNGNDCNGEMTTTGYNLIGDDSNCVLGPISDPTDIIGTNQAPVDPLLGPLTYNGGPNDTHAIDESSPAFDAGGPDVPGEFCNDYATDQRGITRASGAACDIGAFEFEVPVGALQALINAAAPGATIIVPDGTYNEQIIIGDGKTLQASSLYGVIIDATGLDSSAIIATGDFALNGVRVTGGDTNLLGGGVYAGVAGTNIMLTDVIFDFNQASVGGGAIYLLDGTLSASNVAFSNNSSSSNGGAIYAGAASTIVINTSQFDINTANDSGGAIFNEGDLTLSDSTVNASGAGNFGGAIFNGAAASLSIAGTTLSNNTAVDAGGAIHGSGTIEIRNSTLSGNSTPGNGGGINLTAGTVGMNNVTLAFNTASALGGPFYGEPGALISFSNSLLSDNTGGGTNCGALQSLGYNLFQNAPCQTLASDIVAEPLIDVLASNGGPTQTHALLPASPAFDAGNETPLSFGSFDQSNLSQWQLRGVAAEDAGTLLLAYDSSTVGSAYLNDPIDTTQSFSARFQFRMTPGQDGFTADGITFSIVADPSVLGDPGNALGIAEFPAFGAEVGIVEGVSVEFDGWTDNDGDNGEDHVGIDLDGQTYQSFQRTLIGPPGTFANGSDWTAWVDYDAGSGALEVRLSSSPIRPLAPIVSTVVNISDYAGSLAYVGFTGATGFLPISGEHRILNFSFGTETSCETSDQRGNPRPQGSGCDIGAFEGAPIPLVLGQVELREPSPIEQDLSDGVSYPGVTNVPIIDIPIEKLTGDVNNSPAAAPLGSFPLGSFPIGSFDLQASPIGSFPLGSFPIGSFPIGSFPLGSFPIGSFPLSSIPLLREGGWSEILDEIPELRGAPLQTVTLERVLTSTSLPASVADIELRELAIEGSPLASLSLQSLSLGATTVDEFDQWAANAGSSDEVCAELANNVPAFTDCASDDTLMSLEYKNAPVSALSLSSLPLGSFPIGSFPLGSFPIGSFPLGSFPLGSFPIGSFPIGSFPLGSFPLGSFPIGSFPIGSFPLGSFDLDGQSFCEVYDEKAIADSSATCSALGIDPGTDTLADVITALQAQLPTTDVTSGIASTPLGSFPIGSFPIGSFPIGSFPLGSFPIGSFPIGSFPIGSFPIGSFPLGSFPIGSFPVGSFPLGSFDIDGQSFCEFYDRKAIEQNSLTCSGLGVDPGTDSLADVVTALQALAASTGDTTSGIESTPLGSFPIGSFPIGSFDMDSFPIGSFPLGSFPLGSFDISQPPLSDLSLGDFNGCALIATSSADDCASRGLSDSSSLLQVAAAYGGSIEASPLGSFPLGSFGISDLPMGSFPIGSFEIDGTPLGSFPLGSFDLIASPLGSFPIGSFPLGSFPAEIVTDPTGLCDPCETLADAAKAGVINPSATLSDLEVSTAFASVTLAQVTDAMTMATLYGEGTLADVEDLGSVTLGQLLVSMMLKTDFPWETITLTQLDAQAFSADNLVEYALDVSLTGSGSSPVSVAITLDDNFLYVKRSAFLDTVNLQQQFVSSRPDAPVIVNDGNGNQTLTFNLNLNGFTSNTLRFKAVPPLELGDYAASATVVLGSDAPVDADASDSILTVIPDPLTDSSDPTLAFNAPRDVLTLGYISAPDDNDFYEVTPPAAGDKVAVFMSNPSGDNDLIMYEPLTTVEAKGQAAESAPLDSVPFEDDGVDHRGNVSEEPNALEDVNLFPSPLASISTNRGSLDEAVSAVAGDDQPFTIQVSGYNGAVSDEPYTLRVKVTPQVASPQCTARGWPGTKMSTVTPAGIWTPNTNAVFLVNGDRLASSDPGGAAAADAALSAINNLINAPGIIDGVVVDVSGIAGALAAYDLWDGNPCDVDAPNAVVNAITAYLELMRASSPNLAYVTIVGSDEVIPFLRKPDETSISNESTFAGEFSDNALHGALVTRHFLSDDSYGDIDPIPWLDRYLNVPELGVGRLVESAADIQTAAENYLAFGGVLDPQTALSAGYDFVSDAAEDIDTTFNNYSTELGFTVEPALIDLPGVDAANAWTRTDFLSAAGLDSTNPVDQVSFNMHFDFDEALPSSGDAGGDYTNNLISTADLAGLDLLGGIWFTVGCHSGTNVPDISVMGSAPSEDWAQSFSRLGAVYLAQNAFGLGDTEALALTEKLMANFARNLDGNMTIGQAHAFAKQQYFAGLGLYGEYDYKALQAATLFGLPMYKYGFNAIEVETPDPLPVVVDPISGLSSATWSNPDTNISTRFNTSKGDVFSVDGEVQFVHFRPLQPIVRRDVTSDTGVASGAFLTSLETEDIAVANIAFARPVIDLGENETEIESDEVVFPTVFTNIANYKAPGTNGGPFESRDQLNVIVGQFTSPLDGATNGTERLFRKFDAQVFYRPAGSSPSPAMMTAGGGAGAGGNDFVRPEFDNVQASLVQAGGSGGNNQASFVIDVSDEDPVLRVAVLYLESVSNGRGNWKLVDLVQGSGNTWSGGGPVQQSAASSGQIDYMVQAIDSYGNVANSTFKGLFYVAKVLPAPPDPGGGPGNIGVELTVVNNQGVTVSVPTGEWITTQPVDVKVTDVDPDKSYEYSVDSRPYQPLTGAGFQIVGDGVHIVTVREVGGGNPVTFVILVDTTPPQVVITSPAEGEFIVRDEVRIAEYDCLDAGSGITSCAGPVADGSPVPSAVEGTQSFEVSAQDDAGNGPVVADNTYYVVKPLEVSGPVDPTAIADPVTVTASATDLAEFEETVTIDWGDGSPAEQVDLNGGSVSEVAADHIFPAAAIYQVTITVDYEGQFTQTDVVDFVVIYDASAGFVTGGGWFNSPTEAYTPNDSSDSDVTGKAHFGFVSKYKSGQSVPEGSTSFRFAAGDLDFESTSYEWMIISGARARFKGEGLVEGIAEPFTFQITALDADVAGEGITEDGFRIRIWRAGPGGSENVLYDNGRGADDATGNGGTTPLGGGSIKVHKSKK